MYMYLQSRNFNGLKFLFRSLLMHYMYVQQILLYRICHTVHQSKWLKKTNFSLPVHEFGTMSVMIVFFFYFSFTYAPLFCRHLCYNIEI